MLGVTINTGKVVIQISLCHDALITPKIELSKHCAGHGPQGLADWEPRVVRALEGTRILQIETGEDHSLALSDNGEVFSWGRGLSGQVRYPFSYYKDLS